MLIGPDVSHHQESVDWNRIAETCRYGFAKATQSRVDPDFGRNREGMRRAGLVLMGYYHFADPGIRSASRDAAFFLETVGTLQAGEVAVLDLEHKPAGASITSSGIVDWGLEWLERVQEATGRTPLLYTGQAFINGLPGAAQAFGRYPLWVARYGANDGNVPSTRPQTPWPWTFWQFTSNGTVPGVSGRCDVNLFEGSIEQLMALSGAGAPKEEIEMMLLEAPQGIFLVTGGTIVNVQIPDNAVRLQQQGVRLARVSDGLIDAIKAAQPVK